jgi:hypothetical protein
MFGRNQMELLLNMVWLLLALPACWLWRTAWDARERNSPSPLQCLLALGCVLVLLFPVISATDDLHAMRAELEESSKRSLRLGLGGKSSGADSRWHNPPALASAFSTSAPLSQVWREDHAPQLFTFVVPFTIRAGRAPPVVTL